MCTYLVFFFFFKQKTAYEMRISDWSSDVCSSDLAFQECDAIGISRPVTKWNAQIRRTEDVAGVVSKAYRLTTSGRPGPVLLDFPKDMQIGLVPEPAVTDRKSVV